MHCRLHIQTKFEKLAKVKFQIYRESDLKSRDILISHAVRNAQRHVKLNRPNVYVIANCPLIKKTIVVFIVVFAVVVFENTIKICNILYLVACDEQEVCAAHDLPSSLVLLCF